MYSNFEFTPEQTGGFGKLVGYLWDVKNPKKVMCIIHGIGEHAGRYDRMAGYLNAADIAVVSMDLRGHGLSDGKAGHIAPRREILRDIGMMVEEARKLYPDVPLILYGHSMGGNLCLDYYLRGDQRDCPEKYIISGPWIKLTKSFPKPLVSGLSALSKVIPTLTLSSGCDEADLGNLEYTGGYNQDPLVHTCITVATACDCMEVAEGLLKGSLGSQQPQGIPRLLMHGNADKICAVEGSREYAECCKDDENFTYIEWDGYYHEIHNGGPDATGEKVIETIRDYVLA